MLTASRAAQARELLKLWAMRRTGWAYNDPDDLQGLPLKAFQNEAAAMAKRGELYPVKTSHKGLRYFARLSDADAYRAQFAPATIEGVKIPPKTVKLPPGDGLVTAKTKITVLPHRPGRYEVDGPVIGGFATMGIGRYLEPKGAAA